ncbi:MAG: SIMPL domain-containing protein [Thermoanaerobaculia bacterium]|nr:MAG: SIMPL domain-containing protein [Thermoanaerobaculia bacterium]
MSDAPRSSLPVLGVLLAVGLTASGWLVGSAIRHFKDAERYVSVKGLAEREVAANLAIWPVVFSVSGNDLSDLQTRLEQDAAKIEAFLRGRGFGEAEFSLSAPRVTDNAPSGSWEGRMPTERYQVETTVTLRTIRVDEARAAMEASGELVRAGVRLLRSWEYNTQYFFTDLESVKPEMIAAATRDARRAAEKFAQDSGAGIGGIRRATQGYFSIEDRDPFSPEWKKIRVVTSIDYFVE